MGLIEVKDLSKTYMSYIRRDGIYGGIQDLFHRRKQPIKAVDTISFSIDRGELIGFIGPNGAGKSTTIKMLTGILKPSAGDMSIMGYHPFRDRKSYTKHIGVVFGQRTQLWWDIAVKESFRLLRSIYEIPEKDYTKRLGLLREHLELDPILDMPVRKLSLGERIRCDITASLLHNPPVLFLDEPTIGLDAIAKDSIRAFLKEANREFQTTILLTTHDLREIEELCQRIMVLDHGKILYDGELEAVRSLPGVKRKAVLDLRKEVTVEKLNDVLKNKAIFEKQGARRLVAMFDPQIVSPVELLQTAMAQCDIVDIAIEAPSIEDVVKKLYKDGIS